MPSIEYIFKFQNNSDLLLSAKDLRDIYMFGVDIKDQNGVSIGNDVFEFYIKAAVNQLETYLNVKFRKQEIVETHSFFNPEWLNWGFIKTDYPVICPTEIGGFLNTTKQVVYPKEWMSARRTSDGISYYRQIYLVPASGSFSQQGAYLYSGIIPQTGFLNSAKIPNYWEIRYITGFDRVPEQIMNVVGKFAAINLFHIAGDLILGAGIASFSLGIDGLSQSISSTSSATNAGYGARVINYLNDIKKELPVLKDTYKGIPFDVA